MKRIAQCFLLMLVLNGCDYYDVRLQVINQSDHEISYAVYSRPVPDFPSINKTEFYLGFTAMPGDTLRRARPGKNAWSYEIEKSTNKKLNLVIYNVDSLRKYN